MSGHVVPNGMHVPILLSFCHAPARTAYFRLFEFIRSAGAEVGRPGGDVGDVRVAHLPEHGRTVLGASLLLLFLVPTTLIFHTFPVDSGFAMNLALIGALILAITRAWGNGVPSFTNIRSKG